MNRRSSSFDLITQHNMDVLWKESKIKHITEVPFGWPLEVCMYRHEYMSVLRKKANGNIF